MKQKTFIEPGSLIDGSRVFRMHCPNCKRVGVWQTDLNAVENTVLLHERTEHRRAAA